MNLFFYGEDSPNSFIKSFLDTIAKQIDVRVFLRNERTQFKKALGNNSQKTVVLTALLNSKETYYVAGLKSKYEFKHFCIEDPSYPFAYRSDKKGIKRRRFSFQLIDHIITFSSYARGILEQEHIPHDRISVVNPGVNFERIGFDDNELKTELGFDEADIIVTCFAPSQYNASIFSLFRHLESIFSRYPNLKMILAVKPENFRHFRDIVGLLGLSDEIKVFRVDTEEDKENIIHASRIVIFSSDSIQDHLGHDLDVIKAILARRLVILPESKLFHESFKFGVSFYSYHNFFDAEKQINSLVNGEISLIKEIDKLSRKVRSDFTAEIQATKFKTLCSNKHTILSRSMDGKKVSIIIPIYNRAYIISRALDSIYQQRNVDLTQIEIICIDDGSEDDIEKVLKNYPEIRYIKMPHTGRIGRVRNKGLRHAKGQIIAYLDSDDRWEDKHLYNVLKAFKKNPHLGMVITGFRFEHISLDSYGRLSATAQKPFHGPKAIITSGVAHKKMCVDTVGGFPDLSFGEDYYLWLKIMDNFPFKRISSKTTVYSFLKQGDNISYNHSQVLKSIYY